MSKAPFPGILGKGVFVFEARRHASAAMKGGCYAVRGKTEPRLSLR